MAEYIEREAFIAEQMHLYCENCARRKGMKNGKMKFVYAIGEAPCRACDIGDVLDAVNAIPAADVVPVVRCKDCEYSVEAWVNEKGFLICPASGMDITGNDYCSYGVKMGAEKDV